MYFGCYMKIFWIAVFCCFLVGCSDNDKPQLNPQHKVFFTISGKISPEFKGHKYLTFAQTYVSINPKCDHEGNILAGLKESQVRTDYYPVKTNANGNYKIKIPLDKYLPGKCGWRAYQIFMIRTNRPDINLESVGWTGLVTFSNAEAGKYPYTHFMKNYFNKDFDLVRSVIEKGTYVDLTLREGVSGSFVYDMLMEPKSNDH